jgi:glycosyltransferase involved in cell wall biosynthesis
VARAGQPARPIVWLLDGLEAGGAERLALQFAAAPLAWPVWLVGLRPPRSAPGRAAWGSEWEAVAARVHLAGLHGLRDLGGWWRLRRWLEQQRPLLLHAHLRYATCVGGRLARGLGIPLLTTVHVEPGRERGRQRWLAGWERAERRRAARVIYVSAAQRAAWGRVAERERAVVIGNGVRLPPAGPGRAAQRLRLGLPPAATIFITVAVVRAAKGWRTWLQAAAAVTAAQPQAHFVWVGGGEEWEALRAAAAPLLASGRVRLPGARGDVAAWLEAGDYFLFPSLGEAQPTAVMEAMAAGLPLIATRLEATRELAGECACWVAPGDAAGLAEAALAWSGPQRALARAAAAAARARVEQEFSQARWRERLESLYAEVLAG